MTKVLIVIPWFLPAIQAGGPIQSIRNLVEKDIDGFNFDIFTSNKDLDGRELNGVLADQWIEYNNITRVWYSSSRFPYLQLKKKLVDKQVHKIYIIGLYSFSYNVLPWMFSNNSNVILSVKGMLHPESLKIKRLKKYFFLRFLKLFNFHKKVQYHSTDEKEKDHILSIFGKQQFVHLAGNLIRFFDRSNFYPKVSGKLSLLSIALISPMKNHLLILKALAQCKCDIQYHIVGAIKDQQYWNDCLKTIQTLPNNISVTYHGQLQHQEICNCIDRSSVMILPSKSENFGHAIIESLFAGLPVITSNQTPWNNLQFHNAGMNIEPEIVKIIQAIDYFADMNQDEYLKYSNGARKYAHEKYDDNAIIQQYKMMFKISA